jgi:ADP-ribosylglycohydrolase
MAKPKTSHIRGALDGLCIGDALSMPVHWYYNRQALRRDYGWVTGFMAPRNPHPDSILWRSQYTAANPRGEILHDQAQYWGKKAVHYHQFLEAGENTLNVRICTLLMESINENGTYDADDFLQRYIAFMTTPGNHRDTYIEECHRHFFKNYAAGLPPRKCGREEKHIGGLVGLIPLVLYYAAEPAKAHKNALAHLALTHPGAKMASAGSLVIRLLLRLLEGHSLEDTLMQALSAQDSPFLGYPFLKWLRDPDETVIGSRISPACYVEDALPAVVYLALKYHHDPQKALIANTNLGGDNAGRGAVLGALLGAAHGTVGFPDTWVKGLVAPLSEWAHR